MFKLIGSIIKVTFFVLIVIIAGNLISWQGRSVSDRVMAQVDRVRSLASNHVGGFGHKTQKWAGNLAADAKAGYQKKVSQSQEEIEKISSTERQKLRALIEELNTSSSAPARH